MLGENFRIKKGELFLDDLVIPFDFGYVNSVNGKFEFDLIIDDGYNLISLIESRRTNISEKFFEAHCLTEDNNRIEIKGLSITSIDPNVSKMTLDCYDSIKHIKMRKTIMSEENVFSDYLYYLVLEGLKVKFTDITEHKVFRNGIVVNGVSDYIKDFSNIDLKTIKNIYNFDLLKSKENNNDDVIVKFNNQEKNYLTYSEYIEFKRDFVSLLCFINGAEVKVRKECTGSHYSINQIDSQIVYIYSFDKIKNTRYNNYVPIDNLFKSSDKIVNNIFINCFENYREWNRKIDLNSIVFYITNSEQTKSLEEKVFVQMIAFERLTTLYSKNILGEDIVYSPENIEYKPVKEELLEIIEKNKLIFGDSYDTIKSKVGNLNQVKKLSTTKKMFKIIKDVKIEINEDVENLINICRHNTVHVGEIGDGDVAFLNFYLLDELLREIILRLIEYKGPRDNYKLMLN